MEVGVFTVVALRGLASFERENYAAVFLSFLRTASAQPSKPVPKSIKLPGSGTGEYPIYSCGIPFADCVPAIGVYRNSPLKAFFGAFAARVRYCCSIPSAPLDWKYGEFCAFDVPVRLVCAEILRKRPDPHPTAGFGREEASV